MLQHIHEHLKGWFAFVIFGLITVSFLIWGVMYYIQSMHQDASVLAKVNDIKITQKQVDRAAQTLKASFFPSKNISLSQTQQTQLKQLALSQLITQAALVTRAKKQGFSIGQAQVDALITQIPAFQVNGTFSSQRFQQMLYANGLTAEQFIAQLQDDLLVTQARVGLLNSDFILPSELHHGFMLTHQRRDFGYFLISPKTFISRIQPTQDVLKTYYDSHQSVFQIPEKASFQYLRLSPKPLERQITISDAETKQYYEDNLENYYTPVKWQIQEILVQSSKTDVQSKSTLEKTAKAIVEDLQKGESFNAVLKKYKGKTIWVTQGDIDPALDQILLQMQPGQISKPFEMRSSIAIIKLLSIEKSKLKPYASVVDQVKSSLKDQKLQDLFSKKSDELSNITYVNATTLEPAATTLGLSIKTTGLFSNTDSATGILADKAVRDVAFNPSVLTEGNNSNPVMLKNGDIIVLRINKYEAAHVPEFSSIINQVKKAYVDQTSIKEASEQANVILTALDKGEAASTLAKQYRLAWQNQTNISMDAKNIPQNILSAVFQMRLESNNKGASTKITRLSNGDFAVILLKSINLPKKMNLSSDEEKKLKQSLLAANQSLTYQLYVYGAHAAAKIKEHHK
jgi:peptidyl-prolyl cis-trans isomerase D